MTLAERVAEQLLQDVIEGRLPADGPLPTEPELGERFGVSRMTIREAVRILRAQNVVRIVRGRGTEINAPERWTSLDAAVRASAVGGSDAEAARRLLEARRMIEVGAVQLAALRRTEDDLRALRAENERIARAAESDDVETAVDADIRFHQLLLAASGNEFVPLLFHAFGPLLVSVRRRTSADAGIRERALHHHRDILAAIESGDVEGARLAMEAHLDPAETAAVLAELDRPGVVEDPEEGIRAAG